MKAAHLHPHLNLSSETLAFLNNKTFLHGGYTPFRPVYTTRGLRNKCPSNNSKGSNGARVGHRSSRNVIRAVATSFTDETVKVKAVLTVKTGSGSILSKIGIKQGLDEVIDLFGKSIQLELVSSELNPKTGKEKETIKGYARKTGEKDGEAKYECELEVHGDFGTIGAVLVENEHHKEMFLEDIALDGLLNGPVIISCRSWVASKFDDPQKRVFFVNKPYLPSQTPSGLLKLREEELVTLRGNGRGERKSFERIYDYDVYNDIGNPDSSPELKRPVLGGNTEYPYPRRGRTGRPPAKSDPQSESRSSFIYVPRDEEFSSLKSETFSATTLFSVLHAVIPNIEGMFEDMDSEFPFFAAIDDLYKEGIKLKGLAGKGSLENIIPRLISAVENVPESIMCFKSPETFERDNFFWLRDDEFARQTLAGINPVAIELVKEWPLKSNLDPKTYGPPESAITTEIVQREIGGFMSVEEAVKQKKLFVLDYHDLLLPYVNKVRKLKGTTLYGSRTLFFLTPDGTLKPTAIELTRPPGDGKPQWKHVFTPSSHATEYWLWKLAKAHVLAHDSGYHQLVSHWLRTHCATEPYIIAANRQLSVMHPIYKLLHPHFRYTMEINALARGYLINAGGVIETGFSPGKYSTELSAVAYGLQWQFNLQALPNDLINRGMAEPDPSAPHGLKLAIEDYPFANDGLYLWDILKSWMSEYIYHYYSSDLDVTVDKELQSWWTEVRTVGHADKKDSPGWPDLKTRDDLVHIVTTIAWVSSGHHAAVNFGQYTYAGYFPNRPTIARVNVPIEDPDPETLKFFYKKPDTVLLRSFPSQMQATVVMAILDVLSSHAPDEEYLGESIEPAWAEDPIVKAAFEKFSGQLKKLEGVIDNRNADQNLKNRNGAGIVPYELLKPFSEPGVTTKGVPYSISI
ncbi:hypothetical protein MLD38_040299 [Melastoma candidum]|uniref:Uncharacterized protein n=1 Tax=Melastoma candidum TaxID=119954 RepID=A0ACB9L4X8_9MYRT|nr:hypothetical protein MLD38_040299 [Melastoma candidum]